MKKSIKLIFAFMLVGALATLTHMKRHRFLDDSVSASESSAHPEAVLTTPKLDELSLTDVDHAYIQELLEPLANWSMIRLGMNQKEIKARGYRIAHIHVLKCLGHIFSDPGLEALIFKIRGRSTIWKAFSKGFADSLAKFHERGDIMPYLEDFAQSIQLDHSALQGFVDKGNWKGFVEHLFSHRRS